MTADRPQSILAHLDELRWRILKSAVAVVVLGALALLFVDDLRALIERPFEIADPRAALQTFDVTEQWGVLMRIALYGGLILASPVIFYQIWASVFRALITWMSTTPSMSVALGAMFQPPAKN